MPLLRFLLGSLLKACLLLAVSVPAQVCISIIYEGGKLGSIRLQDLKELASLYHWNLYWAWPYLLLAGAVLHLLHRFGWPPRQWRALIPAVLLGTLVCYISVGMGANEWDPLDHNQLCYIQIGALCGLLQGLILLAWARVTPASRG